KDKDKDKIKIKIKIKIKVIYLGNKKPNIPCLQLIHRSALKFLSLNLQRRRPSASGQQVMWLSQLPVLRILVLGNKNCKVVCFFSHLLVGVLDQVPEHLRLHPTTGGKAPRGLPSLPSAGFAQRLPLSSTATFVRQGLVMAQWKSSMHNYEQ